MKVLFCWKIETVQRESRQLETEKEKLMASLNAEREHSAEIEAHLKEPLTFILVDPQNVVPFLIWILNSVYSTRYKSVVCQKTYDERVLMAEKVVAKDEEVSSMRRLHQEAEERIELLQDRVEKLVRENLQLSDSHHPAWARTCHCSISNLEPGQSPEDCGALVWPSCPDPALHRVYVDESRERTSCSSPHHLAISPCPRAHKMWTSLKLMCVVVS